MTSIHKIIDYLFLHPQGKEYSFEDIERIDTGIVGKGFHIPFTFSKGEYYYIAELKNGKKIYLTEVGGVKDDEHEFFIIEELDHQFVNMVIPEESSTDNFQYLAKNYDLIYSDSVLRTLENNN